MNFKTEQDNIKNYIQTQFKEELKLDSLPDIDAYIDDFLDLDRYKRKSQLFYNFSDYIFKDLSNESDTEDMQMSIYLVFQGDTPEKLKNRMLEYSAIFYRMFEKSGSNFGGVADFGQIETVQFYNAAEGNPNLKISEFTIRLHTER